jgi:Na+-transporting methylmalonyl-CoA/oxaloacetate decarboxylase gamma subunit
MYDRDARLLKNGIEIVINTSKILLFILILFIILISFISILIERLLDAFYFY